MSDPDAETPAEAPEPSDEAGLGGRWIAITLAAIAVIAAGVGILQVEASVNESNTARETTRTAVGALRANVIETGGLALESTINSEIESLQREQAFVVAQARQEGSTAPALTADQFRQGIEGAGGELPAARTQEELDNLTFETDRLSLTQDALSEARVTWNDRSTQYTTVIAILAIALFLIGFSLALGGYRRWAFYGLGIFVALLSIGFAAWIYTLDIPETPESAIETAARGTVEVANDRQQRAIDLYTEAIDLDEDFVAPYSRRASARVLQDNPDFRTTGAITSADAFQDAAADLRSAVDLSEEPDFLTLTLISLLSFYAGEYDQAVSSADEAIAINDQVPDVRLLRSAAEVGRGDEEAARESLRGALELLSGTDPSQRTRGLAANYITYLEAVAAAVPERAELASSLEQQLIMIETGFTLGTEPSGTAPSQGSVAVENLRYEGGRLRLRLSWDGLPSGTLLSAIGFERPTPDGPWVQPAQDAVFLEVSGTGEEVVSAPLERECRPTEVRVDVYLNGERVESATGPGVAPTC